MQLPCADDTMRFLSVCQEMKVFFFVLMLLIIHRSVKSAIAKKSRGEKVVSCALSAFI